MVAAIRSITDLETLKNNLSGLERTVFERYYRVDTVTGRLVAPESMAGWIIKNFGSMDAVAEQQIVKVTNILTMEGALFNGIRANRPMAMTVNDSLEQVIADSSGDPFCHPETGTPADRFGRIKGEYCTTASNIAKYDGHHGVIIFKEHHPLHFGEAEVIDYFATARNWGEQAYQEDMESQYYFFMWNCLWKSGASIIHGHAQMTLSRGMHYAKVEAWRRVWECYKRQYHGACYFHDLHELHLGLGLAWESCGVKGLAHLTPVKEKEIILMAPEMGEPLYREVYRVLDGYRRMGVRSFNLALYVPPFGRTDEDWEGFPAIVRIVDRGDPDHKTADVGAMEMYAASVITSDPFRVADAMSG